MKASVIILAWNGIDHLDDCLKAVLAQDYPDFEVVVVDNGSTDGSADFVAEHFPQVRLIRNERNLGFAAGNNLGLQESTGEVLVLLNQDTIVQTGWLKGLTNALTTDRTVGIVGGKAVYSDGTLQHAGGYLDGRGAAHHYGYQQEDVGQFDEVREVDFVTGAALAITRPTFEAIGELDEGFSPAYYEDVDWCLRARKAGFRVIYDPEAALVHKEISVSADASQAGLFLPQRNRLRLVLKHWPLRRLVDDFVSEERAWLEGLGEGGERLIAAVHRAYLYHLLHLVDVVVRRQEMLDAPQAEADELAQALLTLRTVIPLRPARIRTDPTAAKGGPSGRRADLLKQLRERQLIREHEFRSSVPVFGPLIANFRRQWNRVSTKWYVRSVTQQQSAFNALLVTMMESLEEDRQRLGEVLAEYIAEHGREIAELAHRIK